MCWSSAAEQVAALVLAAAVEQVVTSMQQMFMYLLVP